MVERYLEERGHLAFQGLCLEPRLARRLPAELAWRFHALPLAQDRGRITVAMADPNDPEARQAVAAALGPAACVVQCDAQAIDSLLGQIWGEQTPQPLNVLLCAFPSPVSPPVAEYAQALSDLLGAHLDRVNTAGGMYHLGEGAADDKADLFIIQDTAHPLLRRLLSANSSDRQRDDQRRFQQAALVVREPRWPLRRILLILCAEERDSTAVDWVLHLAHLAGSRVTVLAVVPPVPAMYGRRVAPGDGLPGLLTANSPLGQQMRRVARHLTTWDIDANLRLREGSPEVQIRREVGDGDYDLVAVAAHPCPPLRRWLQGTGTNDLFKWIHRPVLMTRPAD